MAFTEPPLFVFGLFVVTVLGALLPIRVETRQDHVILTIAATVDVALLGPRAMLLVWGAVVVAVPAFVVWNLAPRNRERLGIEGLRRSLTWLCISAFAITVGFVVGTGLYVGVFGREYPITLDSTASVNVAAVVVIAAWAATMSVRLVSLRLMNEQVRFTSLDPFDNVLIPYLLPLLGGFPLVCASVGWYRPNDPWPALIILWWCIPLYAATAFDLHRRRLAQDLRRDLLAKQRLAAIGEVSARIVHQSRHQVGLMGWSIHRLRSLVGRTDPVDVDAAVHELDELARAKDRLSQMLASDLLHEPGPDEPATDVRGESETTTLGGVVGEVRDQLLVEAEREGVALDVEQVNGAGDREVPGVLRDVVFNLVDNAIDAATARVVVHVEDRSGSGVVRVCDDGPGLPTPDPGRAFEPFFTSKADGTGMGLAIADALVGDLGGEIRYERSGGMTEFVVVLPPP